MSDRSRIQIATDRQPQGRARVLPVTRAQFEALRDDGGAGLTGAELGHLRTLAELGSFEAMSGSQLAVPAGGGCLWLVGRGAGGDTASMRTAGAVAAGLTPAGEAWSLGLPAGCSAAEVEAAVEGLILGSYRYRLSRDAPKPGPGQCTLYVEGGAAPDGAAVERARALAEGVLLTRDLVNTSAQDLSPTELAEAAAEVARRHGMAVQTWSGEELLAQDLHMVHAVGRASSRPPTFTVIEHNLDGRAPALGLVGKGVVFDSGGLGIKPSGAMELMRKDMGGAGTCIGALDAIGRLGVDLPLLVVLPSAENAIGPDAFRPGDILRSHSGLRVEIGHTDAEGRLLLGDGLSYARSRDAARLLDVATLTGAARVALGPDVPALLGTDEELVAQLLECAEASDEALWRLPLVEAYDKQIDSPWADVNNSSSDRRGGAITAGLFLKRFAEQTPWAHIDLYGWEDGGKPWVPKGANGMCVRTLVRTCEQLAAGLK